MWISRAGRCFPNLFRGFCTSSNNITVQVDNFSEKSKVANICLHHSPVNSLNIPLTLELTQILKDVETSKAVDAIVLKSSLPGVFSAGLNLNDLHGKPQEHLELFWKSVQDCWLHLYSSRLATVAYISGHCLAAGVILAGACDYRLGVNGNYKLGITAARIGMVAPPWVFGMLSHIMGRRASERSIQTGQTFSPEEALEVGLLDRLSAPELAREECLNVLQSYLSVSQESRVTMKQYMKADFINDFERTRQQDLANFVEYVMRDSVQTNIGNYLKKK